MINEFGLVIWITGLSGAGKTSLAKEVVSYLRSKGDKVVMLDGDQLRNIFGKISEENNYDRESRKLLAKQYSKLCHYLSLQGFNVVIATISLFKDVHSWNRKNLPNYLEVFLKVPINELMKRDSKGIYKKFDDKKISDVSGLDQDVDFPENPDVVFEFNSNDKVRDLSEKLITILNKKNYKLEN